MTAIAPCVLPAGTQLGPQVPRPVRLASSLPLRHARLQALARLFFPAAVPPQEWQDRFGQLYGQQDAGAPGPNQPMQRLAEMQGSLVAPQQYPYAGSTCKSHQAIHSRLSRHSVFKWC